MKKQFAFPFGVTRIHAAGEKNPRVRKIRRKRKVLPGDEFEPERSVTFQLDRMHQAMQALLAAFRNETHLFRVVSIAYAPQHNHRPKTVAKGSSEHLVFLFLATLIIYRSVSDEGFKQAVRLYDRHPWLFSKEILSKTLVHVIEAMREIGFIHPWEAARSWYGTAQTLFRDYGGDTLHLLRGIVSVDDFIALKKRGKNNLFPGYGPKLFSLLVLFYQELGVPEAFLVKEAFPVDLHVQRIFLSLELAEFNTRCIDAVTLAEYIRKKISALCEKEKWNVVEMSHALWFLGNRLCGNCQRISDIELRCPLYSLCGGAFVSEPYRLRGEWDKQYGRKQKGLSPNQKGFSFLPEVFGLKEKKSHI
ncbi:MAG: hypothetical protein HZC03_02040 [Candidatus Lloydbacteria bacterium]|nr:hypothetical protein [Candidatus Lloydbacteria bacterium]